MTIRSIARAGLVVVIALCFADAAASGGPADEPPVKVFILNNQWMGMVRQWQEFFFSGRYSESYMDSLPDFVKLAEAFGAVGLRATKPSELDGVIDEMIATPHPVIADIAVDPSENVYPMIPAGAAHNQVTMSPDDEVQLDAEHKNDGMALV